MMEVLRNCVSVTLSLNRGAQSVCNLLDGLQCF